MIPITAASESGNRDFNRDGSPVVSPKGAKGRMQVMPGTNADPGFGVRPAADNSPEERTRVGQDYLAAMVQRYGGDPAKAWAAYNAGPGRVDRALAKGGDWFSKMPADTRKYVMANMSQLRGPQTAMAGTGAASDAMPGASPAGASGGPAAAPSDVPSRLDPNTGLPVGGVAPLNTEGAPTGYAWNAQHTAVEPVPGGEQDLSSYPPAMIHDAAVELLTTGQMPSMGMGGAAIKKAILDERSRIMQQAGISADQLPTFRARYGADKAALQNISGIVNGLQASESALLANLHQVHVTQQQLVHDGIIGDTPFLNKGRLAWARRFGTSEQKAHIKAYEDALNAGQTEYAKFMSTQSGMGNAPTTDSARGRAGELLDEEDAPAATLAGLRQLQIEAANKKNGVLQQRQALEQKLSGYLQPQGPGTAAQVRTIQQYNALPKGARYIDPNGVHRVKQ
jgi:hypothetical protein